MRVEMNVQRKAATYLYAIGKDGYGGGSETLRQRRLASEKMGREGEAEGRWC